MASFCLFVSSSPLTTRHHIPCRYRQSSFTSLYPSSCFRHFRRPRSCSIHSDTLMATSPSSSKTMPVLSPLMPTEAALSSPTVHRYLWDTGPQFVMWYTARPSKWANAPRSPPGTLSGEIRLALSTDGLSWKRVTGPFPEGAVLPPNTEDWWAFDTVHVSNGSVLLSSPTRVRSDGGVYLLYYTGGDIERTPVSDELKIPGARTRIGVALSKDGEHFTRIEGEFPSGAVLDVGDPPSFDDLFVAAPSVIHPSVAKPQSRYVMYYHGATARDRRFAIGRAISMDGFAFSRNPSRKPVLSSKQAPIGTDWADRGVCRPCIIERGERDFVMFVEVIGDDGIHRIATSQSEDGVKWQSLQLVLDVGDDGEWDAASVSHPCAILAEDGQSIQLYYVGRRKDYDIDNGRGTCIGLAQSSGSDWSQFHRVGGSVMM